MNYDSIHDVWSPVFDALTCNTNKHHGMVKNAMPPYLCADYLKT